MVCLSANQFAENLLESYGPEVKRSKLEGRSGILTWKWTLEYLENLWNHVPDEGMPTATAPMEIPTVTPPAPPPEEYVPEIRVHSNSGGGDVAAKMEMVIYDPSCADPSKVKVIGKVVRYTNILEAPIPDLLNEDGILIDTGQIIIAQKLQERKNDIYVTMVSWGHCVTSRDKYITFVSNVAETAVTYLGFEYRSVHDGDRRGFTTKPSAMLGHCSTAERKSSDDAFDGTEDFESAR